MSKRKKKSREDIIMDAIKERGVFELDNAPNKFPTIHWVIAEYILRDFSSPVGYESNLQDWADVIKRALDNAIKKLRDENQIRVYKGTAVSKKILFITTDPNFRDAQIEDSRRTDILEKKMGIAWGLHRQFKNPELPGGSSQQKLIEGDADNNE